MKRIAWLVVLCGCDQLFGIQRTQHQATPFYDGMPDAPFACPGIGSGAPAFTGVLVQEVLQNCQHYSPGFASGRAVAKCTDPDFGSAICEGPVDAMLVCFMPDPADTGPQQPRLSSDGNTMYLRGNPKGGLTSIIAYTRNGSAWTMTTSPFGAVQSLYATSNFVRGPSSEHVIFDRLDSTGAGVFDEWGNDGGTWHLTSTHPVTDLGLPAVTDLSLTSDGMRALVLGQPGDGTQHIYYSDRTALDAPFRAATLVEGLFAQAYDASLNDDCSRVYFTGLGSIFYVQQ